jgi:hypothetical protein
VIVPQAADQPLSVVEFQFADNRHIYGGHPVGIPRPAGCLAGKAQQGWMPTDWEKL